MRMRHTWVPTCLVLGAIALIGMVYLGIHWHDRTIRQHEEQSYMQGILMGIALLDCLRQDPEMSAAITVETISAVVRARDQLIKADCDALRRHTARSAADAP
jgi:hypothetical protein